VGGTSCELSIIFTVNCGTDGVVTVCASAGLTVNIIKLDSTINEKINTKVLFIVLKIVLPVNFMVDRSIKGLFRNEMREEFSQKRRNIRICIFLQFLFLLFPNLFPDSLLNFFLNKYVICYRREFSSLKQVCKKHLFQYLKVNRGIYRS